MNDILYMLFSFLLGLFIGRRYYEPYLADYGSYKQCRCKGLL